MCSSSSNSDSSYRNSKTVRLCKICFNLEFEYLDHNVKDHACSELFLSADKGCQTCQILKTAIQILCDITSPQWADIRFSLDHPSLNFSPILILSGPSSTCLEFYRLKNDSSDWKSTKMMQAMEVMHHVPESTASGQSFSWAIAQLSDCLNNHPECSGNAEDPLLPTRVLDVGASQETIRLLETHGARGQYITLSHCWGDPKLMTAKLTMKTLKDYQIEIPYNKLPSTFRDAVEVTRRLAIRYLWIDSLCIIQRDEDDSDENKELANRDWMRESSNMCSVYQNSYLTIAGASTTGCTSGLFFNPRRVEFQEPGKYRIYARKVIEHSASDFPLFQRGWVVQETLLAPRTLSFGESELSWHCRKRKACQCLFGQSASSSYRNLIKMPNPVELGKRRNGYFLEQLWRDIISVYSGTELSYPSDRLQAVDGLAQYMQPFRRCKYLAGLWEDSLAFDLVWFRSIPSPDRVVEVDHPPMKTRWSSSRWLFPTWSWACTSGRCDWLLISHLEENCPANAVLVSRDEKSSLSSPEYELKLRGVLVPTTLSIIEWCDRTSRTIYHPDYEDQLMSGDDKHVFCLRVLQSDHYSVSLVLVCIDEEKDIYERIGLAFFRYPNSDIEEFPPWWKGHEGWDPVERLITLI